MRILVVDDEFPSRQWLRRLLASTGEDHELAGEATDAFEAIARCRAQPIDLVLMDTELPGMTVEEAARQLASLERPPAIIFLASDDESNPAMAERPVAGCLLKPVNQDQLREALNIARRLALPRPQRVEETDEMAAEAPRRTEISARYRGGIRTVAIADIIFLQADQKYVNVRHLDGELLVDESLRSFEREFPDLFLRIHRNALVARARVKGLAKLTDGTTRIELLDCDDRLAVSRRHLAEVRRWLRERDAKATHRLSPRHFDPRIGQQRR